MAAIKMVNETVPVDLLGKAGTITNTSLSFGYMLCLGLGMLLPREDFGPQVLYKYYNDHFWRLIYILPCILNLCMLFLFKLFVDEDSIMYNLREGKEE
jgi:hypothetical protein